MRDQSKEKTPSVELNIKNTLDLPVNEVCFDIGLIPEHGRSGTNGGVGGFVIRTGSQANGGNGGQEFGNGGNGGIAINGGSANGQDGTKSGNGGNGGLFT
jgi:hypothetical protein